jgi:hypothetical protein
MKSVHGLQANPNPKIEILLVVSAIALSGLCAFISLFGAPTGVQNKAEIIPISLGSKQFADYGAATPSAPIPAARLDLIAAAIHDTDPGANAQARYLAALKILETPVPGGPPKPSPSATPRELAPAVYVTKIRLDPPEPKQQQDVTFNVTFLNTTGSNQTYRWFVFIYRQGQPKPFGQTSADKARVIPTGTVEQPSINTWRMGSNEPCTVLEARVHWEDPSGSRPIFNNSDGQPYVLTFTMCQ